MLQQSLALNYLPLSFVLSKQSRGIYQASYQNNLEACVSSFLSIMQHTEVTYLLYSQYRSRILITITRERGLLEFVAKLTRRQHIIPIILTGFVPHFQQL